MNEATLKRFGECLQYNRRLCRLTQAELAERSGLCLSMIARAEGGRNFISLGRLARVLDALDMTFVDFFEQLESGDFDVSEVSRSPRGRIYLWLDEQEPARACDAPPADLAAAWIEETGERLTVSHDTVREYVIQWRRARREVSP